MRKIVNTSRSQAHRRYNFAKCQYQEVERLIINYKQGKYGDNQELLDFLRKTLNGYVNVIKYFKKLMKINNSSWIN